MSTKLLNNLLNYDELTISFSHIIIRSMKESAKENPTKEKKQKKVTPKFSKKFYVLLLIFVIVCSTLFNFVSFTWVLGDDSLIAFVNEYFEGTLFEQSPNVTVTEHPEQGYFTFNKTSGENVKILQISDLHIGCGIFTYHDDRATVKQVFKAVESVKPDLIIVTGDALSPIYVRSGTKNSKNQLDAFIALMTKIGLPWTFCFGNHDAEGSLSEEQISKRLEATENCLYFGGKESLSGNGNFYIKLYNDGQFSSSLIIMDSGNGNFLSYGNVETDQIEWYEQTINELKAEKADIKTSLFLHIPLPEYKTAWENRNDTEKTEWFYGECNESISSGNKRGFYDVIERLDSTKWVFCGHDHENDFSILMKDSGIRLTYGMSFDYSAYITTKYKTEHRGCTLVEISKDGDVVVKIATQDNGYIPTVPEKPLTLN